MPRKSEIQCHYCAWLDVHCYVVILLFVCRVTKWLEEEPERRKRLQEEKKKRLQQRRAQPKHYFDDQAYMKQLRANEEEMDDALKQGVCVCVCVCVCVVGGSEAGSLATLCRSGSKLK